MYSNPRRPFYNYRTEDMPQNNADHSSVIDSKRFWKLLKKLTFRQEAAQDVKAKKQDEVATTG